MKGNQKLVVLAVLRLFLFPASWFASGYIGALQAQERYTYRVYQDRKEGIVPQRTLVAGEKLVLVSAGVEDGVPLTVENAPEYKLAFYLHEDAKKMSLVVRELKKRYKMEPLRREYPAGLNSFSWPAEIPHFYDIAIHDLAPLAELSDSSGKKVVPVALFSKAPNPATAQYRFCFVPSQAISVLEYKIYPSNTLQPIHAATLQGLAAEEEACLSWRGRDRNNKTAEDGWYHLLVEATFRPLPGQAARKVTAKHTFYHSAEMLKGNWNPAK